jgi:O-antigen ligase
MHLTINFKFFSFTKTISIPPQWLRFGIITIALLASTVVSFWGSPRIYLLLLVMIAGLFGLLALLRQPNLGFIFAMLGGMFVSFVGPSGLNVALMMIAVMLGLWILDMFVVRRNFHFIRSSSMIPLITFLLISILAFLVSQIPWFVFARQAPITAQVASFGVYVFSIGSMILAAHLIKDERWLQIIVWVFIGFSAPYMLSYVRPLNFIGRVYQLGLVTESMFWTWFVALALSQAIFNHKLTRRIKWLLFILVGFTFYAGIVFGYEWKSGWVPPLMIVAILIGLRYPRLILLCIPVMVFAALYIAVSLIAAEDYSWGTRVDAWRIVLEISRVSPFLGMGFANYYWYTPLFPIRGWAVSFNSHSQFVDLIAQTGYLGLLCFLWILFSVGRRSWDLGKRLPDGFAKAYSYGVFAGIIATLFAAFLGDWVLPFVYNVGLAGFRASVLVWIFMGGVISLEQMLLQRKKIEENRFSS